MSKSYLVTSKIMEIFGYPKCFIGDRANDKVTYSTPSPGTTMKL